jgi:two-component system sensor histidine kinase DesK
MPLRLLPKNEQSWMPLLWLIYLVPFILFPIGPGHSVTELALMLLELTIFLPLYFRSHWVQGRELAAIIVAMTLLAVITTPFNYGAPAFFIYAASFAGPIGRSMRQSMAAVAVIVLTLLVEVALLRLDPSRWWWAAFFSIVVGLVTSHYTQVHRANARLRLAQDEVEHLAKVAERERIARDLHDLLGHTLSLIILKSELASKLAERDPQRAREEIRDVERISREALTEVRAAVRGYRAGGLQPELARAREALQTAGLTVVMTAEPLRLAPVQEAVLALAVREAATNILRHADARNASIRLERDGAEARLTVADDGRGGNAADGNGLSGMRERVTSLGGTLTRVGNAGTTLTIALPLPGTEAAPLLALGRGA